jgi:hypothetical protein
VVGDNHSISWALLMGGFGRCCKATGNNPELRDSGGHRQVGNSRGQPEHPAWARVGEGLALRRRSGNHLATITGQRKTTRRGPK